MKISVSNIAWSAERDDEMLSFLLKNNIDGLEIAPSRIFPQGPYSHLQEAGLYASYLWQSCGLKLSSMQSIWYGRSENIFAGDNERKALLEYTEKALAFANAMQIENLVFGCPKNRIMGEASTEEEIIPFFITLGELAKKAGVFINIEANPPIYGTNFLNTTGQVLQFVKKVNHTNIKLNLDYGALVYEEEPIVSADALPFVKHVHISEPYLAPITQRVGHMRLAQQLKEANYGGYVSLEMAKQDDIDIVKNNVLYIKEVFG